MHHTPRFVVALLLAVMLCGAPASAQEQTILHIADVDSTRFPTVAVTVSATTPDGRPLPTAPTFSVAVGTQPMTLTGALTTVPLPLAAAVVVDLSARMGAPGAGGSSRFNNMQPRAKEFLSQFQGVKPGDSLASLIVVTQTVKMGKPLSNDVQWSTNVVNNAESSIRFIPSAGDPASVAPALIIEGMAAGLKQLADPSVTPKMPRLLVVFAADDGPPLDPTALKAQFDAARAEKRPISLLVFGFGSEDPAAPSALKQFTETLGGRFLAVSGATPDAAFKKQVDQAYAELLGRSDHYVLHFEARNDATTVTVSAGGSTDTAVFTPGNARPRIKVKVQSRDFQDRVQLFIEKDYSQEPLTRVQYFLDNTPIGESTDMATGFAYTFNAYDAAFQQKFPPNKDGKTHEYALTAAAWDAGNREGRSTEPVMVQVLAPPPAAAPSALDLLARYWWAALIGAVVVAGGAGLALQRRNRAPAVPRPATDRRSEQQDNDATTPYNAAEDELTGRYDDEATAPYMHQAEEEDKTLPFDPTAEHPPQVRWFLQIANGEQHKRVELSHEQRHYDIGRVMLKDRQAHIALDSKLVSQYHAKLEQFRDDLYLVAGESKNGTFFGEDQQPLAADQRIQLHAGDVFWLSPKVRVSVESVTEQP